jgi:hypothetical protein
MSDKADGVIRIRITIEPSWTISHYDDVIEVSASDVEGLSPEGRRAYLEKAAEEEVNNVCSWGWNEEGCADD